jgi:hypothetical protein
MPETPEIGVSRRDLIGAGAAGLGSLPAAHWISPRDTGGVGDGVADDHAALAAAVALGRPVWLEGRAWRLSRTLESGDHDLTFIGPGTLVFPRRATALLFNPPWGPSAVIDSVYAERRSDFGVPVSCLTVTNPGLFAIGEVVQIRSADPLVEEPTTHQAELTTILDISEGRIWLSQLLQHAYLTAPMLQKLPTRRLRLLQGVRFACADDIEAKGPRRAAAALMIEGACEPVVDVEVVDSPSRGVFGLACWRGDFSVRARNLRDDTDDHAYGYGVSLGGGSRFNHVAVQAERCRHAFTTNVYPPQRSAWCGAPRDNWITGGAVGCTSAAFDTHPGAFDTHFSNLKVAAISANGRGPGSGQRLAFQDRGVRTTLDGLDTDEFTGGVYSIAAADAGYDYINRYSRVRASAGREQSMWGDPPGGVNIAGGAGRKRMTVELTDSLFDGCSVTWTDDAQSTRFVRTQLRNVPTLRTGRAEVLFEDCRRENTTGRSQEPIQGAGGGRLTLIGMHFAGPYQGACVRAAPTSADDAQPLLLATAYISMELPQPLYADTSPTTLSHRSLARID